MRAVALSLFLGVCAVGAANAQEVPASMPSQAPLNIMPESRYEATHHPVSWDYWAPTSHFGIRDGVEALKAGNFERAEEIFADIVRYKRTNASANFYLGVTRMSLGKWADARKHLEIAARKKPDHPDPKSRLGVTYAKLGDAAGARAQRADLVKMANACTGDCERKLARYITGGIAMIDKALADTES